MNYRTRTLWLPALLTFLAASASLLACQLHGMRPHMLWLHNIGVVLYLPWLVTLPMFGALAACLSRRAQEATQARLAGDFPPLSSCL